MSIKIVLLLILLSLFSCKEEPIPPRHLHLELYDTASNPHTLQELSGKVVILDYWASWCTPCKEAGPLIDSLYTKLASENIQFIGINTDNNLSILDIEKYATEFGMSYPIWLDRELQLAGALDIQGQPCLVILNQKGMVVHKQYGIKATDLFYLEKMILEVSMKDN
jgi:thiol-disulfide isomerase/thioredoxin